MQYKNSEFDPELHDRYKALTVKQPYATRLVTPAYRDEQGVVFAEKSIEVRTKQTSYRGDLLVCSSKSPVVPGMLSGVTIGLVELYDVKPVEEFTEQDWIDTGIPENERATFSHGFGYMLRNPRRVVEMPCKGQLGIYNFVTPKGDITEYPTVCRIDRKSWNLIQKKINNGKVG